MADIREAIVGKSETIVKRNQKLADGDVMMRAV
jgi:hypothetical protein